MENKKEPLGVAIYHLKGKFAFVGTNGNERTGFVFDEEQVSAISNYMKNGIFDGMFEKVSIDNYLDVLGVQYASRSKDADMLRKKELRRELECRKNDLETALEEQKNKESQSQPQ